MRKKIKANKRYFDIDNPKIKIKGWLTFTKLKKLHQKAYGQDLGAEIARDIWKNRYVTQ